MKPIDNCRFCNIAAGKYQYIGIDEPFASSNEYMAIASIGAMVEGWSLIVPKMHQLSMKKVYESPLFAEFIGTVLPSLIQRYGPIIAFEHGANKEGSITSCGTDHAHLHLVPFAKSLTAELQKSGLNWVTCHASEIASKTQASEYLFYCELDTCVTWKNPVGFIHILEQPLSQFFRRLIAGQIGEGDIFDYRHYPHLDTARQTRRVLIDSFA